MAKFQKGTSGNPAGRKPGNARVQPLREAIAEHVPEIIDTLTELARAGDVGACRLLLERVLPPVKAMEQPMPLPGLDAGSGLVEAGQAVLQAAGSGQLAPSQASQLLGALASQAKLIETTELVKRIEALEQKHGTEKPN